MGARRKRHAGFVGAVLSGGATVARGAPVSSAVTLGIGQNSNVAAMVVIVVMPILIDIIILLVR